MKSLWIDLFIPVNSTICNLYLHLEILPQSCVKFHFFSFWEEKKTTFFVWKIQLFFVKVVFFLIFLLYFLYGKNTTFWKITQKVYMKTVPFSPYFFSRFVCPLRLLAEIPVKFIKIAWIFFVWLINIWSFELLKRKYNFFFEKIDFFQKNGKKIIFFKIGGTGVIYLPITKKPASPGK